MAEHAAQHPTPSEARPGPARPECATGAEANLLRGSRTGGSHRRSRLRLVGVAAGALVAALTLAGGTVLVGSASAAPAPRPDDLQLGGWVKSCAPSQRASGIDYYTNRGEHGRADVVTGPAGTRYAVFLHRDGRGGEDVTLTVHCAGRRPVSHTTAFHVAGPGNNTEVEHIV